MKIATSAIVGDIHYPESRTSTILDDKVNPPTKLRDALGTTRLSLVITDIVSEHRKRPFDNILFVGDFTDQGDEVAFGDCLSYYVNALAATKAPLFAVPGNHDQKKPQEILENELKFTPFLEKLLSFGDDIKVSFDAFTIHEHAFKSNHLSLYAMNSCISCKELWNSESKRALAKHLSASVPHIPSDQLYDYFDAPYLQVSAIDQLREHVGKANIALPIVLAHHNLLPQRVARVAIFPEMLNSGFVRDAFSRLDQPVLYIHGHTHDDTLEVLANPLNYSQVGLVSVSAPRADQGYCTVSIALGEEGEPLSIGVTHRMLDSTAISIRRSSIIRLYQESHIRDLLPDQADKALRSIENVARIQYLAALRQFGDETIDYLEALDFVRVNRTPRNVQRTWTVEVAG